MITEFRASESVSIAVPSQPISVAHYLRQPQRLIHALTAQSQVEMLSSEILSADKQHRQFRLKMQPLHFLHLTIQPTVDLDVWVDTNSTVYLRSTKTEIRGLDYIDRRFTLTLEGHISPQTDIDNQVKLVGRADLKVSVEMPPILWLTPPLVLEITGNSLLKSVLLTIKQRLVQQLIADYTIWATQHTNQQTKAEQIINPHSKCLTCESF
jgi:hypothetical protein